MENLEIKGVRTPDDIKNVYLKAVEENIKFYRAVSNSGKYYGWETNVVYPQGHHIPAIEGQEWFINDKYVEPVEEPIEQPVEEQLQSGSPAGLLLSLCLFLFLLFQLNREISRAGIPGPDLFAVQDIGVLALLAALAHPEERVDMQEIVAVEEINVLALRVRNTRVAGR